MLKQDEYGVYNTRQLPMSETTYYILYALLDEPLHGYGIMKKVKSLSADEVTIGAGTLYGALDNLTRQGMITPVINNTDEARRKYYKITEEGISATVWEHNRLKALVSNTSIWFDEHKA